MRITVQVLDCLTKVSDACKARNGQFERELKRGRVPNMCPDCKEYAEIQASVPLTGECGCGKTFAIQRGRGKKPTRCDECREAGTVYREDGEGRIAAIQKATLDAEAQERREEAGRQRAAELCILMGPLLRKTDRQVIRH